MIKHRMTTPMARKNLEMIACLSSSSVIGPKAEKREVRLRMIKGLKREITRNSRLMVSIGPGMV